jgi:thymidylate synthase ThyX
MEQHTTWNIATEMNLVALEHYLKVCREHRTYVEIRTLAYAIRQILKDDTELLAKHLYAYAKDKQAKQHASEVGRAKNND